MDTFIITARRMLHTRFIAAQVLNTGSAHDIRSSVLLSSDEDGIEVWAVIAAHKWDGLIDAVRASTIPVFAWRNGERVTL